MITLDWNEESGKFPKKYSLLFILIMQFFTDYVQGVSADFNLLFADLRSQKLEKKSEYLRDQVWLDQTCTLGYSVAGTWNNLSYKNDPTTTTAVHVGSHRYLNIRVGFSNESKRNPHKFGLVSQV